LEITMKRFLLATLLGASSLVASAQGPARHDIVAQCPAIAEQLSEQLASLKNEVGAEGTVRVQLLVDSQGLQRIESLEGPRRYQGRVRSTLQSLDCRSNTAAPQRYVLNIRFGDETVVPATQLAAASKPR
jgi:hypothetical protein